MTVIQKNIGRLPVNLGDYDSSRAYGKKDRVNLYGCEWESKVDNNTYAPATLVGGVVTTDTTHWKLNAGVPGNYGLDTEVANLQTALSTESERAQAAESALQNNIEALTQSNIVVVADHTQVQDPDATTIYREYGESSYADWMYQNGSWNKMAEYDNAIDTAPKIDSNNIVKSKGIYNALGGRNGSASSICGYIRRKTSVGEKALAGVSKWMEDYANCTIELCFKNNGFTNTQFLMAWAGANDEDPTSFYVGNGTLNIKVGNSSAMTFSDVANLGNIVKMALKKKGNDFYFLVDGEYVNVKTASSYPRSTDIYLGSYLDYLAGYVTDYYYVKLTNDDTGETEELINAGSDFVELTSERHALGRVFSNAGSGTGSELTDGDVILVGDITLDSVVTLDPNTHIRGNNCTVHVTANGKLVMGDGCSIDGITFDGGLAYTRTQQSGAGYYNLVPLISVNDIQNYNTYIGNEVVSILGENATIKNCRFDNIDRLCIKYDDNYMAYTVKTQPNISGNYFYNCRCGILMKGEFCRIVDNIFNSVVYGCILLGGNLTMASCIHLRCDVGMLIDGTSNPGHSVFNGVEFQHNGIAGTYILQLPRSVGNVYSGCHWADAPIIGVNCNALLVTSSRLDTWVEIAEGSANAFIANNVYKGCADRDGKPLFGGGVIYNLKVNNAAGTNISDSEINN